MSKPVLPLSLTLRQADLAGEGRSGCGGTFPQPLLPPQLLHWVKCRAADGGHWLFSEIFDKIGSSEII